MNDCFRGVEFGKSNYRTRRKAAFGNSADTPAFELWSSRAPTHDKWAFKKAGFVSLWGQLSAVEERLIGLLHR